MDENLSLAPPWWRASGRAPVQLDSAKELAAAINNDPHYADTIATLLAARPTRTEIAATYVTASVDADGGVTLYKNGVEL